MKRTRVLIMGAAGRDFHNFNVFFRDKKKYEVMGFTATQIPGIENKTYPRVLSGKLYPDGIPIYSESQLPRIIENKGIEKVVFSYSDVSHEYVMHKASEVLAAGADFWLLGTHSTTLKTRLPVISVCATRTGAGKSQTARKIVKILRNRGKRVVAIRHPMPYGDLSRQVIQRFAKYEDFETYNCTIEEREEYEPYVEMGAVIYAGIDYKKILKKAEKEADIIVWDGGNNDFSFIRPDLHIVVTDTIRAGQEIAYHPGETNVRLADIIILSKVTQSTPQKIDEIKENIRLLNTNAVMISATSRISVDHPEKIEGKRVVCVEDGPTLTHGGMSEGVGYMMAKKYEAKDIVSPVSYAVGSIKETFEKFPQTLKVLPAMGYGKAQIKDLESTINSMPVDLVVVGSTVNLSKMLHLTIPSVRVHYELEELTQPDLEEEITGFVRTIKRRR